MATKVVKKELNTDEIKVNAQMFKRCETDRFYGNMSFLVMLCANIQYYSISHALNLFQVINISQNFYWMLLLQSVLKCLSKK